MLTETASTNDETDSTDNLYTNRLPELEPTAAEPKPKLSPAERSRINGRKSKGPRTADGKARVSRSNALTHGITAKSPLLPGEDRSEFEARLAALQIQMRPRNELEAEMLDRLAQAFWVSRRSQRALVAQLTYRLRHEPLAAARASNNRPPSSVSICSKMSFVPWAFCRASKPAVRAIPPTSSSSLKRRSPAATGCWRASTGSRSTL